MKKIFILIMAFMSVSCSFSKNNEKCLSPEYVSQQCVLNLTHSQSISDTLFASISDYALLGYKYEGDMEAVSELLYKVFYRNDSIGNYFDAFLNKNHYSMDSQDTIRIRTMFFIEGFLNMREDILPLEEDSCANYPYFQVHNNILKNDSLYLRYF